MPITRIDLRFSDCGLAQALIDATPPDGVRVSTSNQPVIRASADADMIVRVSLEFKAHFNLVILAAWVVRELLPHLKKRGAKRPRINDTDLTLTEAEVLRLIQDEIHWQQVRDAQQHECDEKKRIPHKNRKGDFGT
jgi:hypothetical protein